MFAKTYEEYLAEMFKYHQFVEPMTKEEWGKYHEGAPST